ncbi:MAG: hypothetical protein B7Y08_29825 [Rhodospirillales bacterium 24-66-33]|nr:MAG: hypothetical protein B7Y08_29825 [Rhodospirillales bacterium 24-66-33]
MSALALRSVQRETSGLLAACAAHGYRIAIRDARTPLQAPDFASTPLRRFVANVCTVEVRHAEAQFWQLARACGADAVIDRFETPDIASTYRMPHERCAGTALVWLAHLQTHDGDRRGPWECWSGLSRPRKAAWLRRRRELLHGLLRAAAEYRAARAALVQGGGQ